MSRTRPENLREACVQEALALIETSGVESLSLREVARRLGVSHQAPYKHFASRDHILAEIVTRAYAAFAAYLDARPFCPDPDQSMANMAHAYVHYAAAHPLNYRLMFNTQLPPPQSHPGMMEQARHAFSLLTKGLRQQADSQGRPTSDQMIELDALYIWSVLHGLSSILHSDAIKTLDLHPETLEQAFAHVLQHIGTAMHAQPSPDPAARSA